MTRTTHGVDEWLTRIAAGQAVGITSRRPPIRTRVPALPTAPLSTGTDYRVARMVRAGPPPLVHSLLAVGLARARARARESYAFSRPAGCVG